MSGMLVGKKLVGPFLRKTVFFIFRVPWNFFGLQNLIWHQKPQPHGDLLHWNFSWAFTFHISNNFDCSNSFDCSNILNSFESWIIFVFVSFLENEYCLYLFVSLLFEVKQYTHNTHTPSQYYCQPRSCCYLSHYVAGGYRGIWFHSTWSVFSWRPAVQFKTWDNWSIIERKRLIIQKELQIKIRQNWLKTTRTSSPCGMCIRMLEHTIQGHGRLKQSKCCQNNQMLILFHER